MREMKFKKLSINLPKNMVFFIYFLFIFLALEESMKKKLKIHLEFKLSEINKKKNN